MRFIELRGVPTYSSAQAELETVNVQRELVRNAGFKNEEIPFLKPRGPQGNQRSQAPKYYRDDKIG